MSSPDKPAAAFTQEEAKEMILQPNPQRFVLFPIKHQDLWEMYSEAKASFWLSSEVDLSGDLKDWDKKMNDNERHFIKMVLAFFASADGIVTENLAVRFLSEVQLPEARAFYSYQIFIEQIHSEMYSVLIDTFIRDPAEKNKLFNAIESLPAITRKAEWAIRYINGAGNFATRLVAFAAVEGIFFSGSFCSIFRLKHRNLMPGLGVSNAFIARDEGSHTKFACLLYRKYIQHKLTQEEIETIIKDAVEIECAFVCDALPVELIGMNSRLMTEYIKFVADHLVEDLGHQKIYHVQNPFEWMEKISMESKTNFFEQRVPEYQKAGVMQSLTQRQEDLHALNFNAETIDF